MMPTPIPASNAIPMRSMRATIAAARPYRSESNPSVALFGTPISGACTKMAMPPKSPAIIHANHADALDGDARAAKRGPRSPPTPRSAIPIRGVAQERREPSGEQHDGDHRRYLVAGQQWLSGAVGDLQVLPRRRDVGDLSRLLAQPHGDEKADGREALRHAQGDDGDDEPRRFREAAHDELVDERAAQRARRSPLSAASRSTAACPARRAATRRSPAPHQSLRPRN